MIFCSVALVQELPHSGLATFGTTTCCLAMKGCEALGNLWQHSTHSSSGWQRELFPPYCTVKEPFYACYEWKAESLAISISFPMSFVAIYFFLLDFWYCFCPFSLRLVSCVLTSWCKQVWRWVLAAMRSTSWCIDTCRSQVGATKQPKSTLQNYNCYTAFAYSDG